MKTKAHTRYRLEDGTIVPGVTTILNILAKPALVPWANRLGLQGIDVTKFVDDKAAIGTLAHEICTCHLMGTKPDYSHYDPHQISQAENSALSFFEWMKGKEIIPILIEGQLVSKNDGYGGTIDIFAKVNGAYELIDLKSGGIWPEHSYQVAAYQMLLWENDFYDSTGVRIINIPRTEDEGFKEHLVSEKELNIGWKIFGRCNEIYKLKKQLNDRR